MPKFLRREPKTSTVVYDLDKVHAASVSFRLHGKDHVIKSLTALEFFQYAERFAEFHAMKDQDQISREELAEGYFRIFSLVCPDLTKEDVEKCSQQQAAVIFGIVSDAVTGKTPQDFSKKKVAAGFMKTIPSWFSTRAS